MANVPSVLLLASAAPAAGGDGEEKDPSGQQRADRRSGPSDAAPLVRGGRGCGQGKNTKHTFFIFLLYNLNIYSLKNVENHN